MVVLKNMREQIKEKKRIVVKIGTTTLTHASTGSLDLQKMEKLVRILTDLNNKGKEVIVVSSGAIGVGRKALGIMEKPHKLSVRQACASVGQARLMMTKQADTVIPLMKTSMIFLLKFIWQEARLVRCSASRLLV